MAKQSSQSKVDLSESSVYGDGAEGEDRIGDATLDRLEKITGSAEESSSTVDDPEQESDLDELDAATEEEIDALNLSLMQDDDLPDLDDGTGRIVDDLAEERIAMLTETEPLTDPRGARSIEPGSDDTSEEIRRHNLGMQIVDAEALVGENTDEPRDEELRDRDAA